MIIVFVHQEIPLLFIVAVYKAFVLIQILQLNHKTLFESLTIQLLYHHHFLMIPLMSTTHAMKPCIYTIT